LTKHFMWVKGQQSLSCTYLRAMLARSSNQNQEPSEILIWVKGHTQVNGGQDSRILVVHFGP